MGNTNKILKDYYRRRLLKEFNFLKLEDSMQEVLARKRVDKTTSSRKTSFQ